MLEAAQNHKLGQKLVPFSLLRGGTKNPTSNQRSKTQWAIQLHSLYRTHHLFRVLNKEQYVLHQTKSTQTREETRQKPSPEGMDQFQMIEGTRWKL